MFVFNILKVIWALPQNVLGFVVALFTGFKYDNRGFFVWKFHSGISLGEFRFLPKDATEFAIKHEYGHTIQSYALGWLYLIIIGIPSIIWAIIYRIHRKGSYYRFYTEAWANKLGGAK